MNIAVISILALVVAIVLSCTSKINVGILGIGLAFIIGVYFAGLPLNDIVAGSRRCSS